MRRAAFTGVLLAAPRAALACPVCFGQSDAPMAVATNLGILVMLGVVGCVLAAFAAFIVNLNRRARFFSESSAGQSAIGQTGLSSTHPQEGTAQC